MSANNRYNQTILFILWGGGLKEKEGKGSVCVAALPCRSIQSAGEHLPPITMTVMPGYGTGGGLWTPNLLLYGANGTKPVDDSRDRPPGVQVPGIHG